MKNKVLIVNLVLLVLTICQSCSSYHATTSLADVDTINIDKSLHEDSILFSTYFKAPKVIPLETKKECLIQNVRSLEIFKDNIYIYWMTRLISCLSLIKMEILSVQYQSRDVVVGSI